MKRGTFMAREFFIPKKILSGDGALDSLSEIISDCGKKALIVTGKNVRKLPCFTVLCDMLTKNAVDFAVFDGITGEPDDIMIESGAELYRK